MGGWESERRTGSCSSRKSPVDLPSLCLGHLAGRIISLSWHPAGTLIAAGMVDMIRIFDANTGEDGSGGEWTGLVESL